MKPRLLSALLLALALGRAARADDAALEKAKDYFRAGAQAYAVGEYAAAVQAFEQANALAPRPAILFSIAQAERRQYFLDRDRTHLVQAVEKYRAYLVADPQGARKVDTVQALSELEPLLASTGAGTRPDPRPAVELPTRVMISSPAADARISLDGHTETPSPLIGEVEPGPHKIHVTAPGFFDRDRELVALKGALVTLDVALAERPAKLVVGAPDGAVLSIDGRVQGECPFPAPLELSPGPHLITLTKSGLVGVSREQVLARGQTTVLRASMPRSRQRTVSLMMLGAGVSSFVAGGVFGYFALDRKGAANDILDAHRPQKSDDLDQYNSAKLDFERFRAASFISLGVGAGLTLGGALLFALDGRVLEGPTRLEERPKPAPVSAAPIVTPTFAGMGVSGAF